MEADLKIVTASDWDPAIPESFGRVYDEHFGRIYNYIRYRVRNAAVADDLTSVTFHKALERRHSFDPERAVVGTWLLVIARNTVHDHLRAQRRRQALLLGWRRGASDSGPTPESLLIEAQEQQRLLAALASLPDRDRDLLGLKFAAGLTNRAIAGLSGRSESHVGVLVHRAVGRLRALLEVERKSR